MKIGNYATMAALLLAGCAGNPYETFYHPAPGVTPQKLAEHRVATPPDKPELFHGCDLKAEIPAQLADGYAIIGVSSYNGTKSTDGDALDQGENVGADRVFLCSNFSRTVQSVMPLMLPATSTALTNGTATAFGSGGMATAYGSSMTTTFGTQTAMMPISIDRYDFLAVYLAKLKQPFGAYGRNLNAQESQQIGSVNGIVLGVVVHGTPAAAAGLLPGDIVTQIDGRPIVDTKQFTESIKKQMGDQIVLSVMRNGRAADVPVSLTAAGSDPDSSGEASATAASAVQWRQVQRTDADTGVSEASPPASADEGRFQRFDSWRKPSSSTADDGTPTADYAR